MLYSSDGLDNRNKFRRWYKALPMLAKDAIMGLAKVGAPPLVVEYYVGAFRLATRNSDPQPLANLHRSCSQMQARYIEIYGGDVNE